MKVFQLAGVIFTVSYCCADSIEISVNEEKVSVTIDGRDFPNPCRYSKCPVGKECTVQYTPKLLKIPVAHCVNTKESNDEGVCVEYTMGTNILSCKSIAEWKLVGASQCPLGNSTHLLGTKVKYPCPMAQTYGEQKYLTASFNCCQDIQIRPLKFNNSETVSTGSYNAAQDINSRSMYIIPTGSGVLLVLAIMLTLIAVGLRYRHSKHSKKNTQCLPKMMSVVNPEVDSSVLLDCSDKAMLITNEQSFS